MNTLTTTKDDLANDISEYLNMLGLDFQLKSLVKMDLEDLDRLSVFLSDFVSEQD